MECGLATLAACFSLSGIYVDSGISIQDGGVYTKYEFAAAWIENGQPMESREVSTIKRHNNPYAKIGLGYEIAFSNLTLSLLASHTSSLADGDDKGINAITLNARWFPFRR